MEIPIVGYGIRDRSLRVSPQFAKNLYPVAHPAKASELSLQHTPGLRLFKNLGADACRMIHVMDETLYALSGTTLYSIDSKGNETSLGTVPGTEIPVVDNNGTELVMALGDSYVYDSVGGTITTLDSTTSNYFQSSACAFVGRRIAFIRNNTGQFFLSNIDDATTFDAADFATAESRPDRNIVLHQFKGHLWIFGARSYEGWFLSDESFPLTPFPNAKYNIGCGARTSLASNEQYMGWLSHNRRVYMTEGSSPKPVSNADLEYELSQMTTVGDAIGYFHTEEQHTFYVLSFPAEGKTFAFDAATGEWHERSSNGGRHLAMQYAYVYGKHLVASYADGKVYEMNLGITSDDGVAQKREFILPCVQQSGESLTLSGLELLFETGRSSFTGNSDIEVRWTDNGHDWSDFVPVSAGDRGQFSRKVKLTGLGSFEERFFHVRTNTDGPARFLKAFVEGDSGQRY